ncbi:B9-domain-containing protein [Caulochytrium protostelioides]|uniref:B9 domain-containing protein 2 n=1 Tax=Caulochytrium protostelioides TaxID=1555241 RepID=A0A4P9WXM3_9FUNG|nr:B9-domain-containing protein [Caulochytrium protostelioides]
MAEVHVVGAICGAKGWPGSANLFCRFEIVAGDHWKLIEGAASGQTQTDDPADGEHCVWNHPLDLHYVTNAVSGWPRFRCEVYHVDRTTGKHELDGYGFVFMPTAPGTYTLDCVTWALQTPSMMDRLWTWLSGLQPQLRTLDTVSSPNDRYCLNTTSRGHVILEVTVVLRHFERYA